MTTHAVSIREDDEGLVDIPLRLIVGLISMALLVPTVLGGWSSVDFGQTEQRVRMEISRVLVAAQRYLQSGSGGELVDVSLRGGSMTRIEYIIIGDHLGEAYSRAVRYRLSGGTEQLLIARNPSVQMRSPDGEGLILHEGSYSIMVECLDGSSVSVSLVR